MVKGFMGGKIVNCYPLCGAMYNISLLHHTCDSLTKRKCGRRHGMRQTFQCYKCGTWNYMGQQACSSCGAYFQYKCPSCQIDITPQTIACPNCGASIPWVSTAKSDNPVSKTTQLLQNSTAISFRPKSLALSYVLAVLLGPLGVHHFYLSKPVAGVLYLVVFIVLLTMHIPYLIYVPVLVDLFLIPRYLRRCNEIAFNKRQSAAFDSERSRQALANRAAQRASIIELLDSGQMPVISASLFYKKDETAHYACQSELYEERIHTHYEGASAGASIRIVRGLYYRIGAYRGRPVITPSMDKISDGELIITNQRVVFKGQGKDINMPLSKLIDITHYSDAVVFHRQGKNKPQYFKVEDPELVTCIAQRATVKLLE